MIEKTLFIYKVKESKLTLETLATEIGINPSTLFRKLNGDSDFTRPEIIAIKKVLRLSIQDVNEIFFAN